METDKERADRFETALRAILAIHRACKPPISAAQANMARIARLTLGDPPSDAPIFKRKG